MTISDLATKRTIRAAGSLLRGVVLATSVAVIGSTAVSGRGVPDGARGPNRPDDPGRSRHGALWVVNRDSGNLAILSALDGTLLEPLLFVGRGAHDICVSERVGKAFVTAEADNAVTVVDLDTLSRTSIPVGPLPHHCEPSADGRTLYVTLASHTAGGGHTPRYAAIDIRRAPYAVAYVTTSDDVAARAHGPTPSADGKTIYVSHDLGNHVTAVDTKTHAITFIAAATRAEESVESRDGKVLWVSGRGEDGIKRVDLETKVVDTIPVGHEPESLMLTPSGRTLIASLRGSPAALSFVDTRHIAQPSELVPIAGAGTLGDLAVISPNGRWVFATFDALAAGTGGVAVVDVHHREVVARWPFPEPGRTHGIAYVRRPR